MYYYDDDFLCWVCMQGFRDPEDADMVLDPNNMQWVCCRCCNFSALMAGAERDQIKGYDPDQVLWTLPSPDAMTMIYS